MITQFAWRYFKGKKSTQAVQIISWVSVIAMAVGTVALIIVLSVFNGFEHFVKNLYTDFYPDMKITAIQGKHFTLTDSVWNQLKAVKGIEIMSKTIEEKVLLTSEENQSVVTLKGVDENYDSVTHFMNNIQYGKVTFNQDEDIPSMLLGIGISNKLGVSEEGHFPINCYVFKKNVSISFDPTQIYNTQLFMVNALFTMPDIENDYAFTSLHTLQALSENDNKISSIEMSVLKEASINDVQQKINNIIAPYALKSANRYEQNKTLYFILKSERWAVYAILTMMLLIASFNIIGSLSMLVIEKEKDIAILNTMGMPQNMIKKIFIATGILISLIGASIGSVVAWIVCWIQIQFGIVKMGESGSFLVDAYPVRLSVFDFILVMATVIMIAFIASWIPAVKASKKAIELRLR
jgi:lipoprotein-releasing system permease protein